MDIHLFFPCPSDLEHQRIQNSSCKSLCGQNSSSACVVRTDSSTGCHDWKTVNIEYRRLLTSGRVQVERTHSADTIHTALRQTSSWRVSCRRNRWGEQKRERRLKYKSKEREASSLGKPCWALEACSIPGEPLSAVPIGRPKKPPAGNKGRRHEKMPTGESKLPAQCEAESFLSQSSSYLKCHWKVLFSFTVGVEVSSHFNWFNGLRKSLTDVASAWPVYR